MQLAEYKRVLSISEAAKYIGVSRAIVESWLAKGLLPYEELPGIGTGERRFRRIRMADIDSFLGTHYKGNKKPHIYDQGKKSEITLLPR